MEVKHVHEVLLNSFLIPVCVFYQMPTSDVPVLCQAGDAQQVPTLSLAGRQRLTPREDGVEVELVTCLQLLV